MQILSKETRNKCLREQIAALHGTRTLAVYRILSRVLRSVRLALYLARRLLPSFPKYFEHLRQLKGANKSRRLAIEITIVLIVKVILLWLIWVMFFSDPIAKEARQSEVTRIILNQTH
jgi:hypothetical protein